ncbi:tRNA 3'-trailer sequence RNase, putative [Plasmodium reichenowi]|uniref:ribonuclease Z n=1 Tax=Plasmodium reichenowi TaxID=5854 RepID=A0A151L5T5_PLARE|nr:tRNA 3'-trailer sequence RNase, putative [Plasmodium reichenowi]KYN94303.1 tRNA 3'-trailer sequence RNase, putative [Plasmodium reichenowi]
MEVFLQLIGWHRLAIPSSLRLFVNGDITLFNCGENVQRFLNEHKLHLARIKNIFFTKITPESIGGLIGLLLTIDNISDGDITIYGFHPLESIVKSFMSSFAKMKSTKIKIVQFELNESSIINLKGNVVITPILINKEKEKITENSIQQDYIINEINVNNKRILKDNNNNNYSNNINNNNNNIINNNNNNNIHNINNNHNNNNNNNNEINLIVEDNKMCENIFTEQIYSNSMLKKRKLEKSLMDTTNDTNSLIMNNIKQTTVKEKKKKEFQCICYLIECPQTPGKFYPEKAKKLNIPSGKYYGILKSGQSITINNRTIHPEEVCDKNIDGRKTLIIDLENENDINALINHLKNKEILYLKNLEYIFHLSNENIINNKIYKDFFLGLKNVKNVKCNLSNDSLKVCPFISSSSLNNFLSKLLPNIFLKYKADTPIYDLPYEISINEHNENDKEKEQRYNHFNNNGDMQKVLVNNIEVDHEKKEQNNTICNNNFNINDKQQEQNNTICNNNFNINDKQQEQNNKFCNNNFNVNDKQQEQNCSYLIFNPLTKFILHPYHKIDICLSETISDLYPDIFNTSKISNILKENEELLKHFQKFNETQINKMLSYPCFYFLGTGCSMPSTFRNVSGIILSIQKNFSIILDFGEGSLYQLYWMSTSWINFCSIIKSFRIIFISHAHADHHVGLYYLLYMRKYLFPSLDVPLILIPITLKKWINLFNELFFDKKLKFVYLTENLEINQQIHDENDILSIHVFKVNHINESYGIKVENKKIGSIVYSADTRPCENVKKFSKNCDILIHEATFDDELLGEAINKKHSTTKEAMDISLEVQCKTLILTHFSQRYPKVPKINMECSSKMQEILNKTIYSFDYMNIPLNLINELPRYFTILLNLLEKTF